MNLPEREEAIFGLFDGTVSVLGVIFGLVLHHGSPSLIAIAGFGGAISATVSMGLGEMEKSDEPWRKRIDLGVAMGLSTLIGSMLPVLPFFFLARSTAVACAAVLCAVVGTWIGIERRQGAKGFAKTYLTLLAAIGLTLGIVALIPASA